jgi:hypothetical protein
MKKITIWFWIISNALGTASFFNMASLGWYHNDTEKIIYGEPGPGDGFLILFLLIILVTFLCFNLFFLFLFKRDYYKRRLSRGWFWMAGLWFFAIMYDFHRTPTFINPDTLSQVKSRISKH